MTNEKKYDIYKKKKILRYLMIFFSLATIILEAFALFRMISFLFGLIPFFLLYLTKYYYAKISESEENQKNKKKSQKKSQKKSN